MLDEWWYLEALDVQADHRAVLDLSGFSRLKQLSIGWTQVVASIQNVPQLEDILLLSYDEPDLTPFAGFNGLQSLVMKHYPPVETLVGIDQLPSLARLGLHSAGWLSDISALGASERPLLTELRLHGGRTQNIEVRPRRCGKLRSIRVSGGRMTEELAEIRELKRRTPSCGG